MHLSMDLDVLIDEVVQRLGVMLDEKLAVLTERNSAEKLITRDEVAKELKVSSKTVANLEKTGVLQGHRFGRRVRFKHSEVVAAGKTYKKYQR